MKGNTKMMKFESVEDKDIIEKINIISNEIMDEYPTIDTQDIYKIASLCETVGDRVTIDDKFKRYYYMLLYLGKNHFLYDKIFFDMYSICSNKLEDELNKMIFEDIIKYNNGEISSFPKIIDYYN